MWESTPFTSKFIMINFFIPNPNDYSRLIKIWPDNSEPNLISLFEPNFKTKAISWIRIQIPTIIPDWLKFDQPNVNRFWFLCLNPIPKLNLYLSSSNLNLIRLQILNSESLLFIQMYLSRLHKLGNITVIEHSDWKICIYSLQHHRAHSLNLKQNSALLRF